MHRKGLVSGLMAPGDIAGGLCRPHVFPIITRGIFGPGLARPCVGLRSGERRGRLGVGPQVTVRPARGKSRGRSFFRCGSSKAALKLVYNAREQERFRDQFGNHLRDLFRLEAVHQNSASAIGSKGDHPKRRAGLPSWPVFFHSRTVCPAETRNTTSSRGLMEHPIGRLP